MPDKNKRQMLTVKMRLDRYLELQAAAEVRQTTMSLLVRQLASDLVKQVKKEDPEAFERELATLIAQQAQADKIVETLETEHPEDYALAGETVIRSSDLNFKELPPELEEEGQEGDGE